MNFSEYLKESAIDIPRNSLDPDVFTFNEGQPPTLKESIKGQIMQDIEKIGRVTIVNTFYIIGSILTKQYSQDSDIDVNVEVFKEDSDDLTFSRLLSVLKDINGKLAIGTKHPINYYIMTDEYDLSKTNGAYDVLSQKWIKEPKEFSNNIQNYFNNFASTVSNIDLTTSELRRDIIDLEYLKGLKEDDVKHLKQMIKSKIYEINSSINYLIDFKRNFKKVRKYDYNRPMTPHEIEQFSSKNTLPTEVTYKLLQKYYYWDFINKLEEIVADKENLSDTDINSIKKAEKRLWGIKESNIMNDEVLQKFAHLRFAWLSNTGNIYPCEFASHNEVLSSINEAKISEIKDSTQAYKNGWVRLGLYGRSNEYELEVEGLRKSYSSIKPYISKLKNDLGIIEIDFFPNNSIVEFKNYLELEGFLLNEGIRDIKLKKKNFRDKKTYNTHSQKSIKGMNRKHLGQVSKQKWQRFSSWRNLGTSRKVIDNAKKSSSGIWRVTPQQVKEISLKYHFYPPNAIHQIKHLGNTGIMIWRKDRGVYYLVKPTVKHKI